MYLTPFVMVFPRQAEAETRVLTTRGFPGLPDDQYALVEAYCTDPSCDCRRVMLNVAGRHQPGGYLAAIGFGFDRQADLAGPYLDPLNRQSPYAGTLFSQVVAILADPAYVARLEAHYYQFKQAAIDPKNPGYEALRRIRLDEQRREASQSRIARVAPKKTAKRTKKPKPRR
jgi:hypothetical protein